MAVTSVTHTTDEKDALDYALKGPAHNNNQYVNGCRYVYATGIRCTVSSALTQWQSVDRRFHIAQHGKRRLVQRHIQAFDPEQLDYRNPDDIRLANQIGVDTARSILPDGYQALVVTQIDTVGKNQYKRKIIHNHILTHMINIYTGKALTGKYTYFYYLAHKSDKVIRHYGLDPTARKNSNLRRGISLTHAEYHIKQQGQIPWKDIIRKAIAKVSDDATTVSWNNFIGKMNQLGITVNAFKKNGDLRKHVTYIMKNNPQHRVRDRKLGDNFSKEKLGKIFKENHSFKYNLDKYAENNKRKLQNTIETSLDHHNKQQSNQQLIRHRPKLPMKELSHNGRIVLQEQLPLYPRISRTLDNINSQHLPDKNRIKKVNQSPAVTSFYDIDKTNNVHDRKVHISFFNNVFSWFKGKVDIIRKAAKRYEKDICGWFKNQQIKMPQLEPIIKKLSPNGQKSLVIQITLYPVIFNMKKPKSSKKASQFYNHIDKTNKVSQSDCQTKINFEKQVYLYMMRKKKSHSDRMSLLKKCIPKIYKNAEKLYYNYQGYRAMKDLNRFKEEANNSLAKFGNLWSVYRHVTGKLPIPPTNFLVTNSDLPRIQELPPKEYKQIIHDFSIPFWNTHSLINFINHDKVTKKDNDHLGDIIYKYGTMARYNNGEVTQRYINGHSKLSKSKNTYKEMRRNLMKNMNEDSRKNQGHHHSSDFERT